jgi:REP element-mobilizing transposase RayT
VLDRLRGGLRRIGWEAVTAPPVFAVTIGTASRLPIFDDIPFGLECARLLRQACERTDVRLFAWCFMPDHACLLLGIAGRTSLSGIVTGWKALCSQSRVERGGFPQFWQRGYAERALPGPEAARLAARYILEKPVRAGLVRDCRDYPLCGPLGAGP